MPLAILLRALRNPQLRCLYTLGVGGFFVLFFGHDQFLLVLALTTANFLVAKTCKKPFALVSALSFLVLGYQHYLRYIVSPSSTDHSPRRRKTPTGGLISMSSR